MSSKEGDDLFSRQGVIHKGTSGNLSRSGEKHTNDNQSGKKRKQPGPEPYQFKCNRRIIIWGHEKSHSKLLGFRRPASCETIVKEIIDKLYTKDRKWRPQAYFLSKDDECAATTCEKLTKAFPSDVNPEVTKLRDDHSFCDPKTPLMTGNLTNLFGEYLDDCPQPIETIMVMTPSKGNLHTFIRELTSQPVKKFVHPLFALEKMKEGNSWEEDDSLESAAWKLVDYEQGIMSKL